MTLIDASPGGFLAVANTLLYSVVAAESAMLVSGSPLALVLFFALVVAVSCGLCAWMFGLMADEDDAPAAAAASRPVRAARPSRALTAA